MNDYGPILVPKVPAGAISALYPKPPYWVQTKLENGQAGAVITCWFGHGMDMSKYTVRDDGVLIYGDERGDPRTGADVVICSFKGCKFRARMRLLDWRP